MDNLLKIEFFSNLQSKMLVPSFRQITPLNNASNLSCPGVSILYSFDCLLSTPQHMTQAHGNQSFRYKLKQWNYTKILITSSKICNWTRKTFWVNILRSLSHERETIFTSQELTCIKTTCIKTTLYRNDW